jgi:hypothetical protein
MFAPYERSSLLTLSPTPSATASIAVPTVAPSAMAATAINLRRLFRTSDSLTIRVNILSDEWFL